MKQTTASLLCTLSASLLLFACGSLSPEEEIADNESNALSVATCDLRTGRGCEAGESCLDVGQLGVCATERCESSRECREGQVCRARHCLRVERDPVRDVEPTRDPTREADPVRDTRETDRACPRGTVPGLTSCAEGYSSQIISREPLCSTCEADRPTRPDRCDGASPAARGDCRQVLGYFFDGRVCVGLSGCAVVDAAGLYRTERACAEDHLRCQ